MPGLPSADRSGELWVLVLAGGDGQRLSEVTSNLYGYERAKQFCAFGTGSTLLELTVRRAARVARRDRIVVMITRHQWREARECLAGWPEVTVLDQPANRDTLPGILWPVLRIAEVDPDATVVILPSDHHVGPPGSGDIAFARALRQAVSDAEDGPERLVLLGADADQVSDGLGWIVPTHIPGERAWGVELFCEKPPVEHVAGLVRRGALVNTFVMAAKARAITRLAHRHCPSWAEALTGCLRAAAELEWTYRHLPPVSFSRAVLASEVGSLRVRAMNGVRWSDIGTPERLAAAFGPLPAGRFSASPVLARNTHNALPGT